jgi:hypothetical protein
MSSVAVPSDLTWELVKRTNAFMVKRNRHTDGRVFSKERFNITGLHCKRHSGIANAHAVDINVKEDEKKNKDVAIAFKRNSTRRPATNVRPTILRRYRKGGPATGAIHIKANLAKANYRPELTRLAIARFHAVRKVITRKPALPRKDRKGHKPQAK